jgi:Flp pilus assembly protein TadG
LPNVAPRSLPRLANHPERSRGQALAELALVVPLLLLVFAAAADLGRAFYAYVAIENAAKEGALFGARNPLCDDGGSPGCAGANNVVFRVQNELDLNGVKNQDGTSLVPSVQCLPHGTLDCAEGDTYEVSLAYDFHLLTPLLDLVVGNPMTLTSTSRATVLNMAFNPTPGLSVEKLVQVTSATGTPIATNAAEIVAKCTEPDDIGGGGYYRSPCLDSSTINDPNDKLYVKFDSLMPVTYRVRVSNSGDVTLTGLTMTDSQDGASFWPATSSSCLARPTQLTVGQTYQCVYTRNAPPTPGSATETQWPNTVTGTATNATIVQDAVTVVVEKPAMLVVQKRVSPYPLGADGDGIPSFGSATTLTADLRTAATFPNTSVTLWYWVKVWNEGAKPATGIQVTDTAGVVPYGTNNASAVCDAAPGELPPMVATDRNTWFECRYRVTYTTAGGKVNRVTATSYTRCKRLQHGDGVRSGHLVQREQRPRGAEPYRPYAHRRRHCLDHRRRLLRLDHLHRHGRVRHRGHPEPAGIQLPGQEHIDHADEGGDTMRSHRRGTGQAMTEFALVLPIFAILLFGIVDLARYVYTANALNNGAREGARFATVAVRPAECAGLTRAACAIEVASTRSWGVPSDSIDVTPACRRIDRNGVAFSIAMTNCRSNDLLTVKTSSEFTLVTPLIAQWIGDLTITGEAQVAVNQ